MISVSGLLLLFAIFIQLHELCNLRRAPFSSKIYSGSIVFWVKGYLTVADRCGLPALRLRIADVDAVLVALGEGLAYARAHPNVQPLRAAAGPQLHEIEAHA